MKTLLTILVLSLLTFTSYAQSSAYAALPKDEAGKVAYTAVVPVEGVSKDELFTRAKEWSARSFGDNKIAERMNDREAGTLIAEAEMKQPPLSFTDTHSNLYRFKIAVYVKEGRYKYQIDEFSYQNINPALVSKDAQQRVPMEYYATVKETKKSTNTLKDFDERVKAIVEDLNKVMTAKKTASKDW